MVLMVIDVYKRQVCVKPCDVQVAAEVLKGSDVLVTTVIGFPHGAHRTEVKAFELSLIHI